MKNRTMLPTLKNNAAAGYQGPVEIEILKGAGLLTHQDKNSSLTFSLTKTNFPALTSQDKSFGNIVGNEASS